MVQPQLVKKGGPWTRPVHDKGVHGPGPWTRSTEGVHGPGVHVLYFPQKKLGLKPRQAVVVSEENYRKFSLG